MVVREMETREERLLRGGFMVSTVNEREDIKFETIGQFGIGVRCGPYVVEWRMAISADYFVKKKLQKYLTPKRKHPPHSP